MNLTKDQENKLTVKFYCRNDPRSEQKYGYVNTFPLPFGRSGEDTAKDWAETWDSVNRKKIPPVVYEVPNHFEEFEVIGYEKGSQGRAVFKATVEVEGKTLRFDLRMADFLVIMERGTCHNRVWSGNFAFVPRNGQVALTDTRSDVYKNYLYSLSPMDMKTLSKWEVGKWYKHKGTGKSSLGDLLYLGKQVVINTGILRSNTRYDAHRAEMVEHWKHSAVSMYRNYSDREIMKLVELKSMKRLEVARDPISPDNFPSFWRDEYLLCPSEDLAKRAAAKQKDIMQDFDYIKCNNILYFLNVSNPFDTEECRAYLDKHPTAVRTKYSLGNSGKLNVPNAYPEICQEFREIFEYHTSLKWQKS